MTRLCNDCEQVIPLARLEVVPGARYCVSCQSNHEDNRMAFMVYSHKTAPELVFVDSKDKESLRLAKRANRRSR